MIDQDPYVHFEWVLSEDATVAAFAQAIQGFVTQRSDISKTEPKAWVVDIHSRAVASEYFFGFNQYLFIAEKPRTVV